MESLKFQAGRNDTTMNMKRCKTHVERLLGSRGGKM